MQLFELLFQSGDHGGNKLFVAGQDQLQLDSRNALIDVGGLRRRAADLENLLNRFDQALLG